MQLCSIPECDKKILAKGWCSKHYTRWRSYGDPLVTRQTRLAVTDPNRPMCDQAGCKRPSKSFKGGPCQMHYARIWRTGTPAAKTHFLLSVDDETLIGYCEKCGPNTPVLRNGPGMYRCKPAVRSLNLKHLYDISPEEYDQLLQDQGGVCAICLTAPPQGTNLSVDHHHTTKAIRSLLCMYCNFAVGHVKEDVAIAERLVAYLRFHHSTSRLT